MGGHDASNLKFKEQMLNKISFQVNELTESCIELEAMLSDTEQKISKLQEEFTKEKNKLAEQIQLLQELSEKNKVSYCTSIISVFKARFILAENVCGLVKGAVLY